MYARNNLTREQAFDLVGTIAHQEKGQTWYFSGPMHESLDKENDWFCPVVRVSDERPFDGIGRKYPECLIADAERVKKT